MTVSRYKLLDLFCGAGGAAMGYHRAGFEIVGVDNRLQRHFPFEFRLADAFDYLSKYGEWFDVIHASPPCQAFSSLRFLGNAKKDHLDLLTPMREALRCSGRVWVIENVYGDPLISPIMLCGTAFGLRTADGTGELRRHRYFESSVFLGLTPPCQHRFPVIGVYGGGGRDRRRANVVFVWGHAGGSSMRCGGTQQFSTQARREAMGIDWMTGSELSQAVPPAYTEWIGKRLIERIENGNLLS